MRTRGWRNCLVVALIASTGLITAAASNTSAHDSPQPWMNASPVRAAVLPHPRLDSSTWLGVSCVSSKFCMAVGEGDQHGTGVPVAERWNGHAWRELTPATSSGHPTLISVSCVSSRFCMAVGYQDHRTVAERWDGKRWTDVPSADPRPGLEEELGSVSCVSETSCSTGGTAIASGTATSPQYELVERWNGHQFSAGQAPHGALILDGISCWPGECLAAGEPPETETDGIWSRTSIPNSPTSVDCGTTLTSCWLTGTDDHGRVVAVDSADSADSADRQWQPTYPVNQRGSSTALLTGIGCVSHADCWVAGSWNGDATVLSHATFLLAQHWNGSNWKPLAISSPAGFSQSSVLEAVSCAADDFCVAVGQAGFEQPQSVPIAAVLSR